MIASAGVVLSVSLQLLPPWRIATTDFSRTAGSLRSGPWGYLSKSDDCNSRVILKVPFVMEVSNLFRH
jgi:hypothetical protein